MEQFEVARHLIVELKPPGVTFGRKELNQVDDYAHTIREKSVFATDKATWDVILVGTDYDSVVERSLHCWLLVHEGLVLGPEPKPGRPRVRVFVRRWRDILDENRAPVAPRDRQP